MPRMIDLVRAKALPVALVQSMSKGAIALPPREILEILVYLANHNPDVQEQAKKTLAGWNEKQVQMVVADPKAPKEVVEYFNKPAKVQIAVKTEEPVRGSIVISEPERQPYTKAAQEVSVDAVPAVTNTEENVPEVVEAPSGEGDVEVEAFFKEHEQELANEEEKPFEAVGEKHEEEIVPEQKAMAAAAGAASSTSSTGSKADAGKKKGPLSPEQERGSVLQKISKLDIKGRIQLALKGTKEERSILIRDSAKLVCLAVLESPKITDGEVEKFASQKNVLEAVLRQIPMKRRFVKNYIIMRNLVFNPRTPLDLSLGLMKNLLVSDLKNLSANKEVSDTIRKLGLKMFKQKMSDGGKK